MENNRPSANDFSTTTHPVVLPTPPNPHPVAARHLGDGVETADAAKEAYLPPDTSADVVTTLPPPPPSPDTISVAPKAMAEAADAAKEAYLPPDTSADVATTLPPPPPSPDTISVAPKAMAEAADAAKEAYLPHDTSADVATTLPPSPPSPDTISVAPKAMAEAADAAKEAYLLPDTSAGPSQHVEDVSALSQIGGNTRICDNTEYKCPSISNCNAEEGDERGTIERIADMPSESKEDEKDTTEVSCVPFYLF
jgi:hypothetical protein